MFNNIGGKIKKLAEITCLLGILASIAGGIIILIAAPTRSGIAILLAAIAAIVLGSLASWISSFVLYGFGELVENSCIQTELMIKKEKGLRKSEIQPRGKHSMN